MTCWLRFAVCMGKIRKLYGNYKGVRLHPQVVLFHIESLRIFSSPLEIPAEHKADTSGVPFLTGSRISQAQNERKPCTDWYREFPHQFCFLNLVRGQSPNYPCSPDILERINHLKPDFCQIIDVVRRKLCS